jgi:hypothetical protein
MGIGALLLVSCPFLLAVGIWRHHRSQADGPLAPVVWSAILGLMLSAVLGGLVGVYLGAQPSHFGTLTSGGETIPGLGWSRTVGDFRVAHFFGLHALQLIPGLGFLVAKRFEAGRARQIVWVGSALYAIWVLVCFVQAVRGFPFPRV